MEIIYIIISLFYYCHDIIIIGNIINWRCIMDWDVFISHASEDKTSFVKPLANRLKSFNLNVWYDEFTLTVGDSLSRCIDKGLSNSRYGIVVLSKSFINKDWTDYELRGLISKEIGMDKVILPIWHNVERNDILKFSPTLADKFALNSNSMSLDEVVYKLLQVIKPEVYENFMRISYENYLKQISPKINFKIDDLKMHTEYRHETLSDELVSRINIIQKIFFDVFPVSIEDTISNFKRDNNPNNEVIIWESMAATYLEFKMDNDLSHEKKLEAFLLLLGLSSNFYNNYDLIFLNETEAKFIIESYNKYKPKFETSISATIINDNSDEE
jgi:hypothetical protein